MPLRCWPTSKKLRSCLRNSRKQTNWLPNNAAVLMVALKSATLKWSRSRGTWDLAGSVKWYIYSGILLLAYEPEGTQFGLQWAQPSRGIPQIELTAPWVVLAFASICLAMALSLLMEPLLTHRCRRWVSQSRDNSIIQAMECSLELGVVVLGILALFGPIDDKLAALPWLRGPVIWLGLVLIYAWIARGCWKVIWQPRQKTR